jgi:YegS/Rv2252/BmrU family lipid kinase
MNAVLIHNPTAGPREVEDELDLVVEYLSDCGWHIRRCVTEQAGQAIELARQAAKDGMDAVLVAGGDGTLSEAVNGLVGSRTALGVLPAGTGNVWAKELGLPAFTLTNPNRLLVTAHLLNEAKTRAIDVGRANDRHFLLFAGLGLDAQVAHGIEPRERVTKRLGLLPYLVASVLVTFQFYGVRTTVVVDGKKVIKGRSLFILISNVQLYGGLLRITPEARLDDGLLDVAIFNGVGPTYTLGHFLRILGGRHLQDPSVRYLRARRVMVDCAKPWPVQIDGDPIGTTPMTFQVVPRALRVLIPSTAPSSLFVSQTSSVKRRHRAGRFR